MFLLVSYGHAHNVYLCWTHVQPVHVYSRIGKEINSLSSAICVFLTEWLDSHLDSSLQRPSHCSGDTSQAVRWECAAQNEGKLLWWLVF